MARFVKLLVVMVALAGAGLLIAATIFVYPKYREYQKIADSFDLAELDNIPAISEVFDYAGMRYSKLEGQVRYVVPLSQISPNFVNALLAREDSRFYKHRGVDYAGIARAAMRNLNAGNVKEGASTITQQLARNTYDLGDDRWRKKYVEALLALRIEKSLSKEKILEAYANRIYYGVGLYGVETAARAYFGKSASELSLSEAAILAGLIRSPNRLSPLEDSRTALTQRDQVLARMEELKMITAAEAKAAFAEPMPLSKRLLPNTQENYAMDAVTRDLAILLPKEVIDRGGLKIYTTIDRRLQLIAEDALEERLAELESEKGWTHPKRIPPFETVSSESPSQPNQSPYVQGALVAIDNETGGIRAVVGGRNFKESPYNRALLAKRQIGSTFKPFVYAAAFAKGMAPGTLVDDSPIRPGDILGVSSWSPENSDGENEGLQPAALGLVRSRNTMTVRVGEFATRGEVRALAKKAGLENVPDVPAIYLGAFETTLKDLTAAYTMFPNNGVRKQPYIIESIEDRNGNTIYKATRAELRCIPPDVDYVMNELLRDVIQKGTATAAKSLGLTVPAAGKTGTTDDYKDAWFIGYTTRLTCGVWVGMDKPQRIGDRGYGSKLALPIWVDFIQNASAWKYVAQNFAVPGDLHSVELCRTSGAIATPDCEAAGTMYRARVPRMMVPPKYCSNHGGIFAGLSTDGSDQTRAPQTYTSVAQNAPPQVPVARAVPADSDTPEQTQPPQGTPNEVPEQTPEPGSNYRMIRTQKGFIFDHPP
ncbi:MAG TPA: PBP1A family penicillin-binding protein [Terrimicrobiaceae bacterium]